MKRSPESKLVRGSADYVQTRYDDGSEAITILDVHGRFPEVGGETAKQDLQVRWEEGDGKLVVGSSIFVLARNAIYEVSKDRRFHIEGNPVTVTITPELSASSEQSEQAEGSKDTAA